MIYKHRIALFFLILCSWLAIIASHEQLTNSDHSQSDRSKDPKLHKSQDKTEYRCENICYYYKPVFIENELIAHGSDLYEVVGDSISPLPEPLSFVVCDYDAYEKEVHGLRGSTGVIAKLEEQGIRETYSYDFSLWEKLEGVDRSKCNFRYFFCFLRGGEVNFIWVITTPISQNVHAMFLIVTDEFNNRTVSYRRNISSQLSEYLNQWVNCLYITRISWEVIESNGLLEIPFIPNEISYDLGVYFHLYVLPMTLTEIAGRQRIERENQVEDEHVDKYMLLKYNVNTQVKNVDGFECLIPKELTEIEVIIAKFFAFGWMTERDTVHFQDAVHRAGINSDFGLLVVGYADYVISEQFDVTNNVFTVVKYSENNKISRYFNGASGHQDDPRFSYEGAEDIAIEDSLLDKNNTDEKLTGICKVPWKTGNTHLILFYECGDEHLFRILEIHSTDSEL